MAALIAAPQVSTEGLGTASQDVGDGMAMRGWHLCRYQTGIVEDEDVNCLFFAMV